MKWHLVMILLGCSNLNSAQSVSTQMGARAAGMGYASSVSGDEASLFNNPGALSRLNASSAFFAYEVTPVLTGANRTAAGVAIKSKWGVAGLGFFRFGDALYAEQVACVAFSNQLGITSLGFKVNYIQYTAAGFETRHTASVDFGGVAEITPGIFMGAYILNVSQSKISEDEHLPTLMVAGLGFRLSELCFITTEVAKDLDYSATWRTGIEYTIFTSVFIRTGFNATPRAVYFGIGTRTHRLTIDYALKFSNDTGTSHQASAAWLFERRTPE